MAGLNYYETTVYKYGDGQFKVVYLHKFLPYELHVPKEFDDSNKLIGNKFESNISRAKSNVLALGLCNDWDYFCTFTLNKEKYDRYNLDSWRKDFSQWIRNQRRKEEEWSYLLIPELHNKADKEGRLAWHMHGLIKGPEWEGLNEFIPGIHPIKLCRKRYRYHEKITEKFGFNSFGIIRNKDAAVRYVLKNYITKNIAMANLASGAHLYYTSNGLKKPEIFRIGQTLSIPVDIDYSNEFMSVAWLDKSNLYTVLNNLS